MPELWIGHQRVNVPEGASVLAALLVHHGALRRSLTGEPRSALCGMGSCFECRARVDGHLVRTCLTPARDGQHVEVPSE